MESDLIITIKPNGDICTEAYGDNYNFDIFKAPETIQKLNTSMFTPMQLDAINHLRFLLLDDNFRKRE